MSLSCHAVVLASTGDSLETSLSVTQDKSRKRGVKHKINRKKEGTRAYLALGYPGLIPAGLVFGIAVRTHITKIR